MHPTALPGTDHGDGHWRLLCAHGGKKRVLPRPVHPGEPILGPSNHIGPECIGSPALAKVPQIERLGFRSPDTRVLPEQTTSRMASDVRHDRLRSKSVA